MTDSKLLARFTFARDESAFARLVERHAPMVYSTCLRMLGTRAAAEEAAQAVFLVLARKAQRLLDRGTLAGWLYNLTYKTARRAQRAAQRRASRGSVRLGPGKRTPSGLLQAGTGKSQIAAGL